MDGPITASRKLELLATARVTGTVKTPKLVVHDGAVLQGMCDMTAAATEPSQQPAPGNGQPWMSLDELARYLEIDAATIRDWAQAGRLPGKQENGQWRFDRTKVETWLAQEKIK